MAEQPCQIDSFENRRQSVDQVFSFRFGRMPRRNKRKPPCGNKLNRDQPDFVFWRKGFRRFFVRNSFSHRITLEARIPPCEKMSTATLRPAWDIAENADQEALRQKLFLRFMRKLREQGILQKPEKISSESILTKGLGHESSGRGC